MTCRVFVGNLNYDTNETQLREALSPAGKIVDLHAPTDRETGRPRGFAFVEFSSEEEARQAIEMFDGFELGGRRLRVNEAEERRGGGGGGGGGGRGGGRRPEPEPEREEFPPRSKPKGSRRNLRAKKRSL